MGLKDLERWCFCCCGLLAGCRVASVVVLVLHALAFIPNIGALVLAVAVVQYREEGIDIYGFDIVGFLIAVLILGFIWKVVGIVLDVLLVIAFFNIKNPKFVLPWLVNSLLFAVACSAAGFSVAGWWLSEDTAAVAPFSLIVVGVLAADGAFLTLWIHVLAGYYALKEEPEVPTVIQAPAYFSNDGYYPYYY